MNDSRYCPLQNVSIMNKTTNFTRVGLLSYPGSGNTWTRHLIQQLTGFCTGSVYCDKHLEDLWFPGECIGPGKALKGCIVYKSHFSNPKAMQQFNKAIILIRNPFDALKAYFNFRFGIKMRTKNPFQALVGISRYNSSEWNAYVRKECFKWQSAYINWLKTFEKSFLLVRYADLKENLLSALRRISTFLNVTRSEADYTCTYVNKEGKYHRKQKYELDITDIFTEEQINMVNGAIMNVMNVTGNKYRLQDFIFVSQQNNKAT